MRITYISIVFPLQLTQSATKQEAGVVVVCQDSVQAIGLDVSHSVVVFMFYMQDTRVFVLNKQSLVVNISANVTFTFTLQSTGS